MTDDDRSLEEIEARLDELRDEKEQADELGDAFADARDALKSIQQHPLVDDPAAAEVGFMARMLDRIGHHESTRIQHERQALREARWRKKAEAESESET